MIRTFLLFVFLSFFLHAQDTKPVQQPSTVPAKRYNPQLAAALGIIPGLGHTYLNDYQTATAQITLFVGLSSLQGYYASRSDYISYDNREVRFNFEEALIGYEMQKRGLVYTDLPYKRLLEEQEFYRGSYPIFSETNFSRALRLWKLKVLAEENPFVKYGEYTRTSRSSLYSDMLGNPILSTMMYSVYSSYRDAGGLGEAKKQETITDLAYSPFDIEVLKKQDVWVPISLFALLFGANYRTGNPVLVPSSLKRDGSLYLDSFVTGISPGIGEEAFFRGYVNYGLTRAFGSVAGIGSSSLLFMLAHEGNTDAVAGRGSRFLAGVYLGWLHYKNKYDIRPGIAVHFWYNFLLSLSMLSHYKADPNFNKSQQEVYFMPINFTFRL
ncbi:MAG: CPBP family intramembrane glutamic endopeptidase [Spirochaetota bacterium]